MIITRRVRPYQQKFHAAFTENKLKRFISIAHRRWGKDEIVLSGTCELAHKRVASYWHCLPEFEQGRKALWTAINAHTGKRRIDEAFPPAIRESKDEQQMLIRFKNGSTWQIVGSDRYNSLVGAGVAGVTFSEWALANPGAWGYIRPMIEENKGWAAFITTPRGRNHAYHMYKMAKTNPLWFAELSSINETNVLTQEQRDETIKEYTTLYGVDVANSQFAQEYLCSFNAAIIGAFYAREMENVRAENRVTSFEHFEHLPVHTAWDIGTRDDTSIWWFQIVNDKPVILDCYSNNNSGVEHYAEKVLSKTWIKGTDYVPHDIRVKEWGSGKTRIERMFELGLKPSVVANQSKADGIQAVRNTLPLCQFHERCEEGISALEIYRRDWDAERKRFSADEYRDWSTHYADAFRYLALAWRKAVKEAPPPPKGKTLQEMTMNDMWKYLAPDNSGIRL